MMTSRQAGWPLDHEAVSAEYVDYCCLVANGHPSSQQFTSHKTFRRFYAYNVATEIRLQFAAALTGVILRFSATTRASGLFLALKAATGKQPRKTAP